MKYKRFDVLKLNNGNKATILDTNNRNYYVEIIDSNGNRVYIKHIEENEIAKMIFSKQTYY